MSQEYMDYLCSADEDNREARGNWTVEELQKIIITI